MKIPGYTEQSEVSIALVTQTKRLEEKVLRHLDILHDNPEVDKRWLDIARTEIERGFMAANRSVLKPKRIGGDV